MMLHRISLIGTTLIFLVGIGFTHHHSQSVREKWSDAAVDLWLIPSMEEAIEAHWVTSNTGTLLQSAIESLRSTLATHQQQIFPHQDWIDSLQVDYVGDHQLTAQRMSRHIDRRLVIDGEAVQLGLSMAVPYGLSWATLLAFFASYVSLIAVGNRLWPKPYTDWEVAKLDEGVSPKMLRECSHLMASHNDTADLEVFIEARNAGIPLRDAASISVNSDNARLFRQLRAYSWSSGDAANYIIKGGKALTDEQARWFRFVTDAHGLPHEQALAAARNHTEIEFDRRNRSVTLGGLVVTMKQQPLALFELICKEGKESATAVARPPDFVPDPKLGSRVAKFYQLYKGYSETALANLEVKGMEANILNQLIRAANMAIAKKVSDGYFFKRYFKITKVRVEKRSMYVVGAAALEASGPFSSEEVNSKLISARE